MPAEVKEQVVRRLARIEGQVRGVSRMAEQDRYCPEVLLQLEAATQALRQVGMIVLRNYLEQCVAEAVVRGDKKIYDELMTVIEKGAVWR